MASAPGSHFPHHRKFLSQLRESAHSLTLVGAFFLCSPLASPLSLSLQCSLCVGSVLFMCRLPQRAFYTRQCSHLLSAPIGAAHADFQLGSRRHGSCAIKGSTLLTPDKSKIPAIPTHLTTSLGVGRLHTRSSCFPLFFLYPVKGNAHETSYRILLSFQLFTSR